jgi:RNA polymerase sigma factor (sigma-70 family)
MERIACGAAAPAEQVTRHHLVEDLEHVLAELPSQEAELLRLRYGINQEAPMPLSAVARSMGVTRDTARGIERRANAAIRDRSPQVIDYLEA